MKTEEILSRRLDPVACKIVGARVKTKVLVLRDQEKNFPQKLSDALDGFIASVDTLASSLPDGVPIRVIDGGADQAFGGFRALLEGTADTLHHVDFLPIKQETFTKGENSRKLLALTFPNGTSFLKDKYEIQWTEMDRIVRALQSDDAKPLIAALKLEEEANRLTQWSTLYGERRGITTEEETSTKKLQDLTDRWHKSYAKLLTQALAFYDDEDDPAQLEKRSSFVGAYQEQLEKIREEDKARREELKKKK
jgi:hypothetical protein